MGPLIGGYLTDSIGWRWIFWVLAIFDAVMLLTSLMFLRETHPRTILYRRMRKLEKHSEGKRLRTKWDTINDEEQVRSLKKVLRVSTTRVFKMLATRPILQIIAIYAAFIYGTLFIVLSTYSTVWTTKYHETSAQSSLHYISIVIGSGFTSLIGGPLNDKIWAYLVKKHKREDGSGVPEYRVPLMVPGAVVLPIGLLWYGWSVQAHLFWVMPDVGVVLFLIGVTSAGQCMMAYVIDAYTERTASALAATQFLRSLLGFAFPLFAPQMYNSLGYGWGNSLMAFLAIGTGWPIPGLIWVYGARLRQRSGCQ